MEVSLLAVAYSEKFIWCFANCNQLGAILLANHHLKTWWCTGEAAVHPRLSRCSGCFLVTLKKDIFHFKCKRRLEMVCIAVTRLVTGPSVVAVVGRLIKRWCWSVPATKKIYARMLGAWSVVMIAISVSGKNNYLVLATVDAVISRQN